MAEIVFDNEGFTKGCPSGQTSPAEQAVLRSPSETLALDSFVNTKPDGSKSIDFMISGAHCAACLNKIEHAIGSMDGVKSARMNLSTMRLSIQWAGPESRAFDFAHTLEDIGYGAKPFDMSLMPLGQKEQSKQLLKAMAVAGFAWANIMLLSIPVWDGHELGESTQQLLHILSGLIAIPTIAYSGRPFFKSAWNALKHKTTNMDVPISLAVLLATSLSIYETIFNNPDVYFDAAVMLLFLLLIGRYLDMRLRQKTGESAQRLAAMQAVSATRLDKDGTSSRIAAAQIAPGDTLLVASGERIPVDCQVLSGHSEIDTSIATGESLPRAIGPGERLYSGMINLGNPLTVNALAATSDSFLSEISNLVEAGEQKKGKFVRIADRAAHAYVPTVHSLAALTFIGWIVLSGDLRIAAINAIAVLIITCPCALGLAVPAVQVVASGRLFNKGVLIKSGDALERLADVDTIVFDKTGTLTLGRLTLSNAERLPKDALNMAAQLARGSRHPTAQAVSMAAGPGRVLDNVQEIAGQGLSVHLDGKAIRFGALPGRETDMTTSWLSVGENQPIAFEFQDTPRQDAKSTIQTLIQSGYDVELLTGDKEQIAHNVARTLGIQHWHANVSPQQKLARLDTLAAQGHKTLMIGDGINDAPALANAYASASPAGAADISRASADIILQGDRLDGLITALNVSKSANRRVKENLSFAALYNLLAVPLAIFGMVNPMIAALAMSGSSMLVTLNALRVDSQ